MDTTTMTQVYVKTEHRLVTGAHGAGTTGAAMTKPTGLKGPGGRSCIIYNTLDV